VLRIRYYNKFRGIFQEMSKYYAFIPKILLKNIKTFLTFGAFNLYENREKYNIHINNKDINQKLQIETEVP